MAQHPTEIFRFCGAAPLTYSRTNFRAPLFSRAMARTRLPSAAAPKRRRPRVASDWNTKLAKRDPQIDDIVAKEEAAMEEWRRAYADALVADREYEKLDAMAEEASKRMRNRCRESEIARKKLRPLLDSRAARLREILGDDAPVDSESDSDSDTEYCLPGVDTIKPFPGMGPADRENVDEPEKEDPTDD